MLRPVSVGKFEVVDRGTDRRARRQIAGVGCAAVSGTPSFFVNGKALDVASFSPDGLRALINQALRGNSTP